MNRKRRKREERQQYIFALKQMVSREIKRKYARSVLGVIWSVLNPLLYMAVVTFVFSYLFLRFSATFLIFFCDFAL